ncbi:histidine kinase [Echinicola strongylocentroti]|uniref:histidine kinase n=2 Tax=Echinicola strongylocentroti TaxID=1795355 RepID=A0A2Z4IR55_9BACT|nr:histidine kinase [Echinicola strongylocentroti]
MVVLNLLYGQFRLAFILLATSAVVLVFYVIGKSKKNFKWGIRTLGFMGYPIIGINFFLNDGIEGPSFYIFLMVHVLILAILPIRAFWLWTLYNFLFFIGLYYIDLYHPALIPENYTGTEMKLVDHTITYLACLLGIMIIIIALKWNYQKQKLKNDKNSIALQKANKELSGNNDQKNKIIALISHDLKNPLLSITKILELVNEGELTKEETEAVMKELYIIASNAQRMSEEILDWATVELKNNTAKFKRVNFKEHCDSMLTIYTSMARQKRIDIEVSFNGSQTITTDIDRLLLIMRNLLQNAIKFTPEGGKIIFSFHNSSKETYITIKDTGKGIAQERLQRLFNMKFDSTEGTSQEKGTGVGLYISNENAKKIGGTLKAESEIGKGSSFTLTLPAHPNPFKEG